jgi:hypothetical protein
MWVMRTGRRIYRFSIVACTEDAPIVTAATSLFACWNCNAIVRPDVFNIPVVHVVAFVELWGKQALMILALPTMPPTIGVLSHCECCIESTDGPIVLMEIDE